MKSIGSKLHKSYLIHRLLETNIPTTSALHPNKICKCKYNPWNAAGIPPDKGFL